MKGRLHRQDVDDIRGENLGVVGAEEWLLVSIINILI